MLCEVHTYLTRIIGYIDVISYLLIISNIRLRYAVVFISGIIDHWFPYKKSIKDKNKDSKQLPFFEHEITELIRVRLIHFAKSF